jgi:hypothetical protein
VRRPPLLLAAQLAELAAAVDAAHELRVGGLEREILEAIEGALAVHEIAARVTREVAIDALDRHAVAYTLEDQTCGAASHTQRVRALDPSAALEAERAAQPREDLEELLVGLRAQRIGHLLFGERLHRHEDLAVALAALLRLLARLREHLAREGAAAQQMVAERLAHQVRTHRDRIAVAQLDPLALLLVREVKRARRAQPVQVVQQRGEGDALETARCVRAVARRRFARPRGCLRLGTRDAARNDLEQPLERDRLREQVDRLELVRALRAVRPTARRSAPRRAGRASRRRSCAARRAPGARRGAAASGRAASGRAVLADDRERFRPSWQVRTA